MFLANLDKVESKLLRLSQDYSLCLDTVDDMTHEISRDEIEREKSKCQKAANQRINELTKYLEIEGKNKLFSMQNQNRDF